MTEPKDPSEPEEQRTEELARTRAEQPLVKRPVSNDQDLETDALLDSLMSDPFPSSIQQAAPAGPKAYEPARKSYADDVTVVGQSLEDILGTSGAVPLPAAAYRTSPAPPLEITMVGKGLDELLAQAVAADSVPPPPVRAAPPIAPHRPQAPRPRVTAAPGPPEGGHLPDPFQGHAFGLEASDDDETRLYRVTSRPESQGPPAPASPSASELSPEPLRSFEPESFVPPAAYLDSLSPGRLSYEAPTPPAPRSGLAAAALGLPGSPSLPALRAELESEAPADQLLPPVAPSSLAQEPLFPPLNPTETHWFAESAPTENLASARPAPLGSGDPPARDAWLERAEWLELEAHATSDPQARARAFLVASELWAIAGERPRARAAATAAASTTARDKSMVGRQVRWLDALDHDYPSVAEALDLEARSASTADARQHAAYLAAELQRLVLGDLAVATKKHELLARSQNSDPRSHLFRLTSQLATSAAPPVLRWPDLEHFQVLGRATEELMFLRGSHSSAAPPSFRAFDEARRALAQGDRPAAAEAILRLSELPGLGPAGHWLAASLLGAEESTRSRAIDLLRGLQAGESGPSACRAIAARALELGDWDALIQALEAHPDAFSAADRVVLRALCSPADAPTEPLLRELGTSNAGGPLATAVALTRPSSEDDEIRAGSAGARSALALGRRIARGGSSDLAWLRPALGAFAEHSRHPLGVTLGLELSLAQGSALAVATGVAEWPLPDDDAITQRDRELICALLYEVAGETAQARAAYERALVFDPACEPAVRVLAAGMPDKEVAELFERVGEAEAPGSRAALHFVEAAVRRGSNDGAAFHSLLEKAVEADPKLILPYRLGEQLARRRGDAERLLAWVRARRPSLVDPMELAIDLVREALLVAETDLEAAASLLREASQARPKDFAIAELYERVAPGSEPIYASVRESAAERAHGTSRRRLLLEAALAYERASDKESAARTARAALEGDPSGLARVILERVVLGISESTGLAEELIGRAKNTDDAVLQRELFGQLSEIDAARGNLSSALLWQSAILERAPRQLSALRRLEHTYLRADRKDDLEPVLAALAEALSGADAIAAARLAARLRLAAGNWSQVRVLSELAVRADPNALWALRTLSAHASAANDSETSQAVERRLFDLVSRPVDKATLALRAAEAAARLERWEEAQALLEHALDQCPDHLVALETLSDVLERREELAAAAHALEAVARANRVSAHQVAAWYGAAVLWLDRVDDPERGRAALEQAVALDLGHEDAVARLQAIYVSLGDRQRLAALLQSRLEQTHNPEERIAIEVARGRALAEIGEPAAARAALSAALDANPDHLEALQAFAQLCLTEGDWLGAEQALIRLARRTSDSHRQAQIYAQLGELYDLSLPNLERAELAYQEVLKRVPNDTASADRLILVYGRLGASEKAITLASRMLESAETPEERRERTIRLATVQEQIAGNKKQAELTLEKARREWPHDAGLLRSLAEMYTRNGERRPAQLLLDRAAIDARRALGTGRFEPALFETLATVADLRGSSDGAEVAHATLAALSGNEMPVRGAGAAAGGSLLDELLAPDLLGPSLRALLAKTGAVLDKAYPLDLRGLRAGPLPPESQDFSTYVRSIAEAFLLSDIQLFASPVLGLICLPGGGTPPTLVFGQALLRSEDDAARYCLLIRALTILKARASSIARTAPIDLGPILGGLLSLLVPSFQPQGVDPKRLNQARALIQEQSSAGFATETANLALEVSHSIGNRASQLATALYQWGNRSALLAAGDPLVVLRALAIAGGSPLGPPAAGPDRVRWIVRSTEARDLMIFSVSDQYLEARRSLGLGTDPA